MKAIKYVSNLGTYLQFCDDDEYALLIVNQPVVTKTVVTGWGALNLSESAIIKMADLFDIKKLKPIKNRDKRQKMKNIEDEPVKFIFEPNKENILFLYLHDIGWIDDFHDSELDQVDPIEATDEETTMLLNAIKLVTD